MNESPITRAQKIARLLRTVKHLTATQVYHQALMKGRRLGFKRGDGADANFTPSSISLPSPAAPFLQKERLLSGEQFGRDLSLVVLNTTRDLDAVTRSWQHKEEPKLWRYNLHYFEYLNSERLSSSDVKELMQRWISSCSLGMEDAWEAYPVSLRLMNWSKAFIRQPEVVSPAIEGSFVQQYHFLRQNEEKHLLANHYLKNLIALSWGSLLVDRPRLSTYLRRMVEEMEHQFFADGGHYERSPSYHCVILEMLLDTLNILPEGQDGELKDRLRSIAHRALQFLTHIRTPDGMYPLFGDSAFNVAPYPEELLRYGARLREAGVLPSTSDESKSMVSLETSGIFKLSHGKSALFIKNGGVSPSYQPGHTHCDIGSFELFCNGEKLITDAGVYEYAPGPRRKQCRETRFHNTLSVDHEDQHEIWGEFRVGRRAKVIESSFEEGDSYTVAMAHDGFSHLPGAPIHRRTFSIARDLSSLEISEEIKGSGSHTVEAYLNFTPGLTLFVQDNEVRVVKGEELVATIELGRSIKASVEEGSYWPCFGVEYPTKRLVLSLSTTLPCQFSYIMTL